MPVRALYLYLVVLVVLHTHCSEMPLPFLIVYWNFVLTRATSQFLKTPLRALRVPFNANEAQLTVHSVFYPELLLQSLNVFV